MNRRVLWGVGAVAFLFLGLVLSALGNAEGKGDEPTVHVSQLKMGNHVIGRLGEPLGSKLVVEGKRPSKVFKTANALAISKVNDVALPEEVVIEIKGALQVEAGIQYRLEGYESGGYQGTPTWVPPPVPQLPFQFMSYFIARREIEPTE